MPPLSEEPPDRPWIRIRVAVSNKSFAYNENFCGYSPHEFKRANVLVRYLALVFGSKFTLWLALITSGEFGFERDVIEKVALDRIPVPDFRKLAPCRLDEITELFDGLHLSKKSWDDVDHWVADLYGLGPTDLQIISATLAYNRPFAETKIAAQARPDPKTTADFCAQLQANLSLGRNASTRRSACAC